MGISRRVTDPIKVASVTCDTSIDQSRTPMLDYTETRDQSLLVPVDGETITLFTLDQLPGERADAIRSMSSPLRERIAFQASCSACSDPSLLPPDAWEMAGERRRIRQRYMDQLPDKLPRELGAVALKLGELSEGEERRFGPPGGSLATPKRRKHTTAASAADNGPRDDRRL